MAKNQQEYADAIDTISRKVAAGEMTEGEAAVWREKLLAESSRPARPASVKILIVLAVLVVGIIIMRIIVAAMGG